MKRTRGDIVEYHWRAGLSAYTVRGHLARYFLSPDGRCLEDALGRSVDFSLFKGIVLKPCAKCFQSPLKPR